jgi:hypothetical protein
MTSKKASILIASLTLFTIILSTSDLISGQIYIWTDEQGIVHLTNLPTGDVGGGEVVDYNESSSSTYEPSRDDYESIKQNIINRVNARSAVSPRRSSYSGSTNSSSMNSYYETQIKKLEIDKERYKNRIKQPHSISDYEYYNNQLRKLELDIQHYRSKIK